VPCLTPLPSPCGGAGGRLCGGDGSKDGVGTNADATPLAVPDV